MRHKGTRLTSFPPAGRTRYHVQEEYDDKGILRVRERLLDGLPHSPNNETPAYEKFDEQGRLVAQIWMKDGREHREDSPSTIHRSPKTGVVHTLYFMKFGEPRPAREGPHTISFDKQTGQQIDEVYSDAADPCSQSRPTTLKPF